jgi:predicted exporter
LTEAVAAEAQATSRAWRWLAWAWLLAVLALGLQQVAFWRAPTIDTDIMALLPGATEDARLAAANQRLADAVTGDVVVLLSARDWQKTRDAARAFAKVATAGKSLRATDGDDAEAMTKAIAFHAPHRQGLLTAAQRHWLQSATPDAITDMAMARLYSPVGGGLGRWQDDPLGLWPTWWQARAGQGMQLRDGLVAVRDVGGRDWALLRFHSAQPAFRLDGDAPLQATLDAATRDARKAAGGSLDVLRGGVPLHAEAAASRAAFEVNTIGLGSLLAVLLLVWLAFRSLRPIALVGASLLVGLAAAIAVTSWLFGQVHLITLVFGASLAGVAEDYGIHYFACRQGHPDVAPRTMMRNLLPALALALLTSVLAYMALGIAPFPGLRQMAVFATTALTATFITAVLWFPWLDAGTPRHSRFAARIAGSLARWPRWRPNLVGGVLALVALVFIAGGLQRLHASDDLRGLQASPPELLRHEIAIGKLLGLPSPAQYFLVEGDDAQAVLRAEERLTDALQREVDAGRLQGWRAVSDSLPSLQRQQADRDLVIPAEMLARSRVAAMLGEPPPPSAVAPPASLQVEDGLRQPLAAPLRPLWLGEVDGRHASIVMLQGLTPAHLAAVAASAHGIEGVRWVDRTATFSSLLRHYRLQMGWLLLAGYVAVGIALLARFGRNAWRAWLPTVLAALLSLAALGWLGVPLQLFGVLAQLLLLGLGVDYGIFLLEHREDGASWLAVCLGAASTLLAFGLLSLSATPALHGFGLTLLFGIGLVWLLSPCLRPDTPRPSAPHARVVHPASETP